ncbi:MAG: hypothetical protein Q8R38_00920 [Candidatus Omnitrophota bacterium]|nr:hypothetical protein [Candidatus Omnitrophota bacterium]
MRIARYAISILILTVAALVYVHQQIELVKLSYEIDCKDKKVKEMLDQRDILRYNISNLESPSRLENALSLKKVAVSYPKKGQVIILSKAHSYSRALPVLGTSNLEERTPIFRFFDFLAGRAEAHAREK